MKSECVPVLGYRSLDEAHRYITAYIDGYYSQHSPHQHHGGMPPNRAEKKCDLLATGFSDVVVWNPGAELCAKLSDMQPTDYRHMLCVEAAVVEQPVVLQAGESWCGAQYLSV